MPTDTLLTDPSAEASRSSNLLSRFSSPLSKRARNVFDFTIEPEELYKTFSPGDKVRGHIVLSVLKGFDITHLTIGLHGFAKVFKHQSERRPTPEDLAGKRSPPTFDYLGNGLVSLFHDEQVLCGSGFLKKQIFKFEFELQFPNHSLPTTIDFERGMVSYMISATVTRPTTIAPTVTKAVQIKFRDRIDIENLYKPKTRVITLEPINRRGKVKKVKTSSSVSTQDTSGSTRTVLTRNDTQSSDRSRFTASLGHPPLSPAPSEDTIATTTTTASTESMQGNEAEIPVRKPSPQTSETRSSATSSSGHTITATIELARHGALPGDVVPIRVSVTHTKPKVRGVIIATLYRTIRVDMYPDMPLPTKNKDKKQHENMYPQSITGLGGLYFANSAPSSVFRKDISQNSTMMVIDPRTLTADVSTSIKIPVEDALPTMTNIPGGMMSFTYHVEVVIDLAGKLGESRLLPSLTNNGPTFTSAPENGNHLTSDWSRNILDTTQLRRTKSVVTSVLPITIGTKDTRREQEKAKMKAESATAATFHNYDEWNGMYGPHVYDANGYWHGEYQYDEFGNPLYDEYYGYDESYAEAVPHPYISPPQQQEEGDEKSRLRRQEELLMPSQPPEFGESSNSAQALVPSAPVLNEGDDLVHTSHAGQDSLSSAALSISRASARSGETIVPDTITPPPSLPDEMDPPSVTEDKQELERRRLMTQASAPPTDHVAEGSSRAPLVASVATAPTIDEDEEFTSQVLNNEYLRNESLPKYQR